MFPCALPAHLVPPMDEPTREFTRKAMTCINKMLWLIKNQLRREQYLSPASDTKVLYSMISLKQQDTLAMDQFMVDLVLMLNKVPEKVDLSSGSRKAYRHKYLPATIVHIDNYDAEFTSRVLDMVYRMIGITKEQFRRERHVSPACSREELQRMIEMKNEDKRLMDYYVMLLLHILSAPRIPKRQQTSPTSETGENSGDAGPAGAAGPFEDAGLPGAAGHSATTYPFEAGGISMSAEAIATTSQ